MGHEAFHQGEDRFPQRLSRPRPENRNVEHHASNARDVSGGVRLSRRRISGRRPSRFAIELCGKTIGLIGLGRIGRATAEVALAFGMTVLAYDVSLTEPPAGVRRVDLETLLRESDVVSLHCPLTAENRSVEGLQSRFQQLEHITAADNCRGGAFA